MKSDLQSQFDTFHAARPEVYKLFKRFAWQVKQSGRKCYSSDAILHRIRWHTQVDGRPEGGEYKINDHYSAYYARLLAANDPINFGDFFEFRRLVSVKD